MSTPLPARGDGGGAGRPRPRGSSRRRLRAVLGAGVSACVALTGVLTGPMALAVTDTDPEFRLTKGDLEFILKQIDISESHAAGNPLLCEDPADTSGTCVPDPKLPWGLRTVDGSFNNLEEYDEAETYDRKSYGAGGVAFPRIADPKFVTADPSPFGPPGGPPTSYAQKKGTVVDADPRMISNLVVDQTVRNPAAMAMVETVEGSYTYDHDGDGFDWEAYRNAPGYDPLAKLPGTPNRVFIPNLSPDVGLSAPFTGWFTLFGQFFDHGLDLVSKGGAGTVLVPVLPGDELYVDPATNPGAFNFIPLTRATNQPGPDGVLGDLPGTPQDESADDVQEHTNRTTPFIDQNQTYTSHPSHQVFLREYVLEHGRPVPTGHLLDGAKGGAPTWNEVKHQARTVLGIVLDDMDALNVPLVATDPYGHFVPGFTGFPQLVHSATDRREGDLDAPADATGALKAGVAFLDDIANGAEPKLGASGEPALEEYDAAKLGVHYITGDGRGNENIGLTAVHHVFHSEHNRVATEVDDLLESLPASDAAFVDRWHAEDKVWNYGERVFQAARLVTEMEYQHLVFEEFVRTIQPQIDAGPLNETLYASDVNAAVSAEFAHAVYRFGHSMLTSSVDREGFGTEDLALFDAFLNPAEFTDNGRLTADQGAAAVLQGMAKQTGNGIDEFVDSTLRNQLLGLPLDLASINIARARDTGMPTLNELRAVYYAQTLDSGLKPYANWEAFRLGLKNRPSIVNFVAAYGKHPTIAAATTVEDKRAAAQALISDPASTFMTDPAAATGVDDVDLWVGGLAERNMDFGGMLGSTFNAVFEGHMESLQAGDRFYYLFRVIGTNLIHQLEGNSFSELAMRNTDATLLHHNIFANPTQVFDLSTEAGRQGLTQVNGVWTYDGEEHVVIHGSDPVDDRISGGIGDDSIWGHDGEDELEGHQGNDIIVGGKGNDMVTDLFGDDVLHGGDGNDAINAGSGLDLLFGGFGNDFVLHGQDATQSFAGGGRDFVKGGNANDVLTGNEDDDWLEGGLGFDLVQGDNALTFQNDPVGGADVLIAGSGLDDHDAEGGDDIMDNNGIDRHAGMLGFDWVTHKHDPLAANADLSITVFQPPDVILSRSRYAQIEGLSGWDKNDVLRGSRAPGDPAFADDGGHELTQEHLDRIVGLRDLLGGGDTPRYATQFMVKNAEKAHNIILGGAGSDIIEGGGGDDFLDGDVALDFWIEHRPQGGPVTRHETMQTVQAGVFDGTINAGDVHIVRGVVDQETDDSVVDTAVYEDLREMFTITANGDGTYRVAHTEEDAGGLSSGVDTLRNIERIKFADTTILIDGAVDPNAATGTIDFSTMNPVEDEELSVVPAFSDADGIDESTIVYTWQWADDEGEFTAPANGIGPSFTPGDAEAGWPLRVVATFTDLAGNAESVTSPLTSPVRNVNDAPVGGELDVTEPNVGDTVTLSPVSDPDGTHNDDGDLIVEYRYQWQQSNGNSWTNIAGATSDSFTVTEAQLNRRLRVQLRFTDFQGTAELIQQVTQPVGGVATFPDAPAIGTATAGHESATVTWTAPASTGNADLLGYAVEVLDGSGQPVGPARNVVPGATSLVVKGLTNGSTYTFRVQAMNVVGVGEFSAPSNAVTLVSLTPGAPTVGAVQAGDTTATVAWSAPTENAGAITGYEVQVINAGGVRLVQNLPADATSAEITGLFNGTPYTFAVRALNADGAGAWSAESERVTPAPATADPTVSGVIRTGTGPLAGATVGLFTADTQTWKATRTTDAQGRYSVEGLAAGSYKVYVAPNEPGFSTQWFGGASFAAATPVTVTGPVTVDVVLAANPVLSGVVSTSAGPLEGATVGIYLADTHTWKATRTTDASGAFTAGLAAGAYKVYVLPNEAGYANQWHGGPNHAGATAISVTGPTPLAVTLTGLPSVTGEVTTGDGPLAGATVALYTADTQTWKATRTTDAEGRYSFTGIGSLTAGSYKVYVLPNEAGFPNQWFGGATFAAATPVQVGGPTTVDVALAAVPGLSGVVSTPDGPLAGATVGVYVAETQTWKATRTTDAEGRFDVVGLPAGAYKVYVLPNEAGYANQWHGGTGFAGATPISVTGRTDVAVTLAATPTLTGVVTAGDAPLAGATVGVYLAETRTWKATRTTDADGAWSVVGLAPGAYKVFVIPNEEGYADHWHGGTNHATATAVQVNGVTAIQVNLAG